MVLVCRQVYMSDSCAKPGMHSERACCETQQSKLIIDL